MTDLITAAKTQIGYARNEYESGDIDAGNKHLAKAEEFLQRAAGSTAAAPAADSADEPFDPTTLSRNAGEAVDELLTQIGLDPDATHEPGAIKAAASPEQERVLALLGAFGAPGTVPDVDYSLYTDSYHQVDAEHWEPNQPADDDTWHPWTAFLDSQKES